MPVVKSLTDLGDLAVLLPLAAVMMLWLLAIGRRREALWWAAALALCAGGTAVLKIYFFACPPAPDLTSPSGHASLSALIYGAIVLVVAVECRGMRRLPVIGAGAALVLAIALSRVLLGAHSPVEVIIGAVIGAAALALFARAYLPRRPKAVWLRTLLIASAVLVFALHGHELHAEEFLHAVGLYLRAAGVAACG